MRGVVTRSFSRALQLDAGRNGEGAVEIPRPGSARLQDLGDEPLSGPTRRPSPANKAQGDADNEIGGSNGMLLGDAAVGAVLSRGQEVSSVIGDKVAQRQGWPVLNGTLSLTKSFSFTMVSVWG